MSEFTFVADRVIYTWPTIVGELPKSLTESVAVLAAAQAATPVAIEDEMTVANAERVIRGMAEARAHRSSFAQAKYDALIRLSLRVLRDAAEAVPELKDRLQQQFTEAVAAFSEAVAELPEDRSPDAIFKTGPGALDAYHRAKAAQEKLQDISGWLTSLHDLPAFAGDERHLELTLLKPSTRVEYRNLLAAEDTESALSPLFLTAVDTGVLWEMHTPAEAAELDEHLNGLPVEYRSKFVTV